VGLLLATETIRAIALAFLALGGALAWMSWRASSVPSSSPQRLVAEFRVVRFAALLLVLTAGAYVGLAAARAQVAAGALDVALSIGFLAVASVAVTRDPRQALMMLAAGFAAHALLDIAHRPGLLSPEIAPRWFLIFCAVYDTAAGALCYLPLLRR
jgi:hypothetical protein